MATKDYCPACASKLRDDGLCYLPRCEMPRTISNLRAKLAAAEKVIEAARELDGEHCFTEHGKFDCPIDTTKRAIAAYDALQPKHDIDSEVKDLITQRRLTCEDMPP